MPSNILENVSASSPDAVTLYDAGNTAISESNPLPTTATLSGTGNQVKILNSDNTDNSLSTGGQIAQKVHIVGDGDKYIGYSVSVLDGGNTTSTLLAAAGVFTGTYYNCIGKYAAIQISCFINVPGFGSPNTATLTIQFSSDGVNADGDLYQAAVGGVDGNPVRITVPVSDNYYRVSLTNGAYDMVAAGGSLRLTSVLHPVMVGNIVRGNGAFVVAGDGSGTSLPAINIGGDDGAGNVIALNAGASGELKVIGNATGYTGNPLVSAEKMGPTGTSTNVTVAATSTTLASSSASRRGMIVHNDSSQILYLKYGSTASATSYAFRIEPGTHWIMPMPLYSGTVTGIAAAATGTWRVTTW